MGWKTASSLRQRSTVQFTIIARLLKLCDIVHEGTHAIDMREYYGYDFLKSRGSWEKRAFFYERQFQISMGVELEYETVDEMLAHIWGSYDNELYNPYKN